MIQDRGTYNENERIHNINRIGLFRKDEPNHKDKTIIINLRTIQSCQTFQIHFSSKQ